MTATVAHQPAVGRSGESREGSSRRRAGHALQAALAAAPLTVAAGAIALGPREGGEMLALCLLALGSALVSCAWFARRFRTPLAIIARAAESASRGPFDAESRRELQSQADRGDEVGRLASAVSTLMATVSSRLEACEASTADLAHEIRNPLASLSSAAQALRTADGARRERLLEIIAFDVNRLDVIVGELVGASRLDADLVREQATRFDLLGTIRGLAASFERSAKIKGVDLILDLPAGHVFVTGLEARLMQVIVNVVENAISLCDEGDAIRIMARLRGDRLFFVVEDTGPGIPEGAVEEIFRRFYSQRPSSSLGGNSGLGLAIARQIVEAHGGAIWAEDVRPTADDLLSQPLGARFVVALAV